MDILNTSFSDLEDDINPTDISIIETEYQKLLAWYFYKFFPVFHLFIAFFVFLLNLLVIVAFFRFEKLRTLTNYFIFNLAISDWVMGLALLSCRAVVMWEDKFSPDATVFSCLVKYLAGGIAMNANMMSLLCVSIERYIKLFYALRYEEILTPRRVVLMIAAMWVLVVSVNMVASIFHHYTPDLICNASNVYSEVYAVYINATLSVPLCFALIFIYGRIGWLTHQHRRQIQAADQTAKDAGEDERRRRKELKIAVMMAYLVIIVIIVYSLMLSVNILSYAGGRGVALKYNQPIPEFTADYIWLEGVQIGAVALMSMVNPLIYHWKSPEFRRAFRQILGCPGEKGDDSYLMSNSSGTGNYSKHSTTLSSVTQTKVEKA